MQKEKADGYVFLSPLLGSDSARKDKKYSNFVKHVNILNLFIYAFTKGKFFAHKPAVFFNYDPLSQSDPLLLKYYTCSMSVAAFPRNVQNIFLQIKKPCALFIGEDDEQFEPSSVIAYKKYLSNPQSFSEIIDHAAHLSILLKAPDLFEQAWHKFKTK